MEGSIISYLFKQINVILIVLWVMKFIRLSFKLFLTSCNSRFILILFICMNSEKNLDVSLSKLDCVSINKNQLNSSSSKMQYSFPKTSRFSLEHESSSSNKFYEIPTTKTKRATSFGYGNKLDLSKRNFVTPPPDRYQIDSQFKQDGKNGLTMAPGRKDVKANDMFYRALKQSPQPASYNPKTIDGSLKYSIHAKLQDQSDKWIKCVPGPGAYSYLDLTSNQKSPVAKYSSVTSGKFDHLPRLSEVQMRRNKNPGPNEYKNTAQLLNGYKYIKRSGNVFSRSVRQGIQRHSITPGPGNQYIDNQTQQLLFTIRMNRGFPFTYPIKQSKGMIISQIQSFFIIYPQVLQKQMQNQKQSSSVLLMIDLGEIRLLF